MFVTIAFFLSPECNRKMDFNHSETNSVPQNFLQMYVDERKSVRFNNFTSPALKEQEDITASFYILIMVGFFGFLLFSLMISNIISNKPENYIDYLYSGKFSTQGPEKGHQRKDSKDTLIIISNKSRIVQASYAQSGESTHSVLMCDATPLLFQPWAFAE
uniref:Uncharacterized protein n=1 Tax=Pelusios castaneus TaxID=367368 RepID=A0A8C8RYX2_9SAUR